MFLDLSITSCNSTTDLAVGQYMTSIDFFERSDGGVRATLSLYTKVGDSGPSAADLVVAEFGGSVRMCDFVKLPDGSWRDASGLTGNTLLQLFPRQILSMQVVRTEAGTPVEVKHEQ